MNKDKARDVGDSIVPQSEKDITEDWIEKVVGMKPIPNSVSVEGNIQDGVGFLSYMCRVSFETEEHGTQHIMVKLLPSSASGYRDLVNTGKFDQREIQFYDTVKPKLTEIDPSLEEITCKVYLGKYFDHSNSSGNTGEHNTASMLVMEDLRPLGYQMFKPESQLWEENLTKVVKCMARLHCASLTLERTTNSKISELFPFHFGSRASDMDIFLHYVQANVDKLDAFLEEHKTAAEIRAAYREIAPDTEPHFWKIMKETMTTPCLIHGDLWYSNIMISENNVKFIDWQLLGYRDPTAEVAMTIMACLPFTELRKENLDRFCTLYYETCEELGNTMGKSRAEFQQTFDTWGLAYAYLWFLTAIGTASDLEKRCKLAFEVMHTEYQIGNFLKKLCQ